MIGSGVDTGQSRAETDMLAMAGAIFYCGASRKMVCTSKYLVLQEAHVEPGNRVSGIDDEPEGNWGGTLLEPLGQAAAK